MTHFKRVKSHQLQVSTGPNSSLKLRHTGPYAVIALMNDKFSCIIEDLNTGSQSQEHFTIRVANYLSLDKILNLAYFYPPEEPVLTGKLLYLKILSENPFRI